MFCLALGLGLHMTFGNELSLYSKLKAMVTRHTDIETSLKPQQAVYCMSHLYHIQRLITYPAVTTVEVLNASSTEAEAELLLYFSQSAWSSALNVNKGTTLESAEDRMVQSSLEEQYLLLTEEDSPDYEIWNDMLRSHSQISTSVQVSILDDHVEAEDRIDGSSYDSDSDSHTHGRIISISSSTSGASHRGREQSDIWSSSSSGSLYSEEKDPYQTDPSSSSLGFSFDSLVLQEHQPFDLLEWVRKFDDSSE